MRYTPAYLRAYCQKLVPHLDVAQMPISRNGNNRPRTTAYTPSDDGAKSNLGLAGLLRKIQKSLPHAHPGRGMSGGFPATVPVKRQE